MRQPPLRRKRKLPLKRQRPQQRRQLWPNRLRPNHRQTRRRRLKLRRSPRSDLRLALLTAGETATQHVEFKWSTTAAHTKESSDKTLSSRANVWVTFLLGLIVACQSTAVTQCGIAKGGVAVRADEKLTAFLELESAVLSRSVPVCFFKSERNRFSSGGISALDSGGRFAKRIHV